MDDPELLAAYFDFYWPVSRCQARRAIQVSAGMVSLRTGGGAFPFRRVIDAGSGPGPVAAAFLEAGAVEAFLLDRSPRALSLALSELPLRCHPDGSARPTSTSSSRASDDSPTGFSLGSLACDIGAPDPARIPLWGRADCVSFGHSLNELWSGEPDRLERRCALLERYATALAPGGAILVIEPALLSTSRDLLAVRNTLVGRGWTVLAPCPGRSRLPCPALAAGESQTCHDEIFWKIPPRVAQLADSIGLDKESLKMTWFLLRPPGTEAQGTDAQGTDAQAAGSGPGASRAGASVDPNSGAPEGDRDVFRVVSDPMLNKSGRVRRLVCGREGRFPLSAPQDSPDAERSGFTRLLRGDFVSIVDPERRDSGWGVSAHTVVVPVPLMSPGKESYPL